MKKKERECYIGNFKFNVFSHSLMSKGITITLTMLSMFLFTLLTIGIQINGFSVFAQESEIETINATSAQEQSGAQAGNATSAQEQSGAQAGNATSAQEQSGAQAGNATSAQEQSGAQAGNATSAQEQSGAQAGNATSAQEQSGAQAGNATSSAAVTREKPDAATIPIGESFAQQGTLTSMQNPLPGHEAHQLALILPPREDGAIYQGTLTYTASKPTEIVILQNFANQTAVDPFYGGVATAPLGEGTVAISLLTPQYGDSPIASASVPFAGNALALHTIDGEPFAATYTVSGYSAEAQTYNAITPPPLAEATAAESGGDEVGR